MNGRSSRDSRRAFFHGGKHKFQLEGLERRQLLAAGALDLSFGTGGKVTTDFTSPVDGEARHAVVVQADGKNARKVPVQVAGTYGDEDVIHGAGLKADQPLVLTGNYQLEDGMQIRLADETARVQK